MEAESSFGVLVLNVVAVIGFMCGVFPLKSAIDECVDVCYV
jgi:hypothetical protein